MSTDAKHQLIDEAVISGLRPQARRYDVAVDEQLVVAVLPNGAKTWTWVYTGPGQPHRQTLGIYPEMTLESAREALNEAQAAHQRSVEQRSPTYVIRDGKIQALSGPNWKIPAAIIGAVVTVSLALGWWFLRQPDAPPQAPAQPSDLPATMTLDTQLTAAANAENIETAALLSERRDLQTAPPQQGQPDSSVAPKLPAVKNSITSSPVRTAESMPAPATGEAATGEAATETIAPGTVGQPNSNDIAVAVGGRERPVQDANTAPAKPAAASSSTDANPVTPPADASDTPVAAISAPGATAAAIAERPTRENPVFLPGQRVDTDRDITEPLTDARVARGQLTSAVVQREPIDDLGDVILGSGEDIQTVAFFTELRQLAGQRIRHRWLEGDRVMAEVPFNIGEAWRWRVYSSKRLLRSQGGSWRVQVLLDDDTVIFNYPFVFQP